MVKTRTKRHRIEVRYDRDDGCWYVWVDGDPGEERGFATKTEAVGWARRCAHDFADDEERAQVVVYKRNGRIQTEWTYPRSSDPRRRKG